MKNKLNFLIILAIMVFVLGCSCGDMTFFGSQDKPPAAPRTNDSGPRTNDPAANKSLTDKATDVVTTGEKIGIQECDELMDLLRTKIENNNTDFATKLVLKAFESVARQQIKQSLEQANTDRDATAALCQELKKQFDEKVANPQN